VILSCRFPVPSAVSCLSSQPVFNRRRHRRRNRQRFRGMPATQTNSAQTEPLEPFASTLPPRLHRPAPSPPPTQATSPTAPPPIKRPRKRRCELELLRGKDNDHSQSPPFTLPTIQSRPPTPRSPSPPPSLPTTSRPSFSSPQSPSPHTPRFSLATPSPASPPPDPTTPSSPPPPPTSPLLEPVRAPELAHAPEPAPVLEPAPSTSPSPASPPPAAPISEAPPSPPPHRASHQAGCDLCRTCQKHYHNRMYYHCWFCNFK
jgi:hypothetical protein